MPPVVSRHFKLMLFRKPDCDEEHTLEMSPNTNWTGVALAKDLPINSDQEVVGQKWFLWHTSSRDGQKTEVEVDRTSWPSQHATKTNGSACIHRSGQMLSLQISYSLSPFSPLSKKKEGINHLFTQQFNTRSLSLGNTCVCVNTSNILRQKQTINPLSAIWRIYPSSKWSSQWPYDGYIRHGWMTSCGRGRDSATRESFGRGSRGTIFVRSSKLSLFSPEIWPFRRVFLFPALLKDLAPNVQALGLLVSTMSWRSFWKLRSVTGHFFANSDYDHE